MLIHSYSLVIVLATRFERQKEVYTDKPQHVNPLHTEIRKVSGASLKNAFGKGIE
jgi:hypothetical protein